jgi:membrane protease subunit HflK
VRHGRHVLLWATENLMAWNEPGGGKRDPWSGGGGGGNNSGGGNGNGNGPDFERWLKSMSDRVNRIFGGGRGRNGSGTNGTGGGSGVGGIALLVVGALVVWFAFDSFTVIEERERGVVLRFGEYTRQMDPGLNFKFPRPIESVLKVDYTSVRSVSEEARMLTRDEALVLISFNIQYRVLDPRQFLFGTRDPDDTVSQTAESAVRQVIGANTLDEILIGQRAALVTEARRVLQDTITSYGTGIEVTEVSFQRVEPPPEVKAAFDDAIAAREDKQRLEREAEAYASRIVPESRGSAARITVDAEGYKEAKIARAEGEAARFTLLADEYRKSPEVTRKRLLLETMEEVLANNPKVMLDVREGSQSLMYLPLDQILKDRQAQAGASQLPGTATTTPQPASTAEPARTPTAEPRRDGRTNGRESRR